MPLFLFVLGQSMPGVRQNLRSQYVKGRKVTWPAAASCTVTMDVLDYENFLGKTGERTIFIIELTLKLARINW